MPNSAITFNTAGLATTTSPGLVGTGAQTFAGDKTFNGLVSAVGGIINTGLTGANATTARTTGSLKVGEVISFTTRSLTITNASTWYNSGAGSPVVDLTAGLWALVIVGNGGTTNTSYAFNIGTGTSGLSGQILGQNLGQITPSTLISAAYCVVPYQATSAVSLYGMAYSLSASTSASVSGFAIRIA